MQISETPIRCEDLDLMKQLLDYARGVSSWRQGLSIGESERSECNRLHAALVSVISKIFNPMLDRVNSREMRTFTMHDSKHGLKVSHLMWNIIEPSRRAKLTPPEIALLVISAYLHDLGMAPLEDQERQQRLSEDSDLWHKADILLNYKKIIKDLENKLSNDCFSLSEKALATKQIAEAQDMLLCIDCRERHATKIRYEEILQSFKTAHLKNPVQIPQIDDALRYGDDSFESVLIEICVSHNEDASTLLEEKQNSKGEARYPTKYPIGTSEANLRFIAATLRLADILDFDRERVPTVLYHYLLPRSAKPSENISIREWQKHMTISNWDFSKERIVFRGRSKNAIAHHAVIEFCNTIEQEICRTRAIFNSEEWDFNLAERVQCDLHSEGFTYHPYKFELRQNKMFELLMGKSLYSDSKHAIRELVQNSVDSCLLRDALIKAYRPSISPSNSNRIKIILQEKDENDSQSLLIIEDSGTGMDQWIIENYLLKVGDSYYNSTEFLRSNAVLWQKSHGFSPVSEFGIGFLSCFMLASHIQVETAMPTSPRQDYLRRVLEIDGMGRLICVTEFPNTGYDFLEGTRVTLRLNEIDDTETSLNWRDLVTYVQKTCINLPYELKLQLNKPDGFILEEVIIKPKGTDVKVPSELEPFVYRIKVGSPQSLVEGEVVIFPYQKMKSYQKNKITSDKFLINNPEIENSSNSDIPRSTISRGGFYVGEIPGLPTYTGFITAATGKIKINPRNNLQKNYLQTNIARTHLVYGKSEIENLIIRSWLEPLIKSNELIDRLELKNVQISSRGKSLVAADWLENYSAYDVYLTAKKLIAREYQALTEEKLEEWENGTVNKIPLGIFNDYLFRALFELVLPFVSKLIMGYEARLSVESPKPGWIEILKNNHSFIKSPNQWLHFACYEGQIKHLLYFSYPGSEWISDKFEPTFDQFTNDELSILIKTFRKLIDGFDHGYLTTLSNHEVEIFRRAAEITPQGLLGSISSTNGVPIASFLS